MMQPLGHSFMMMMMQLGGDVLGPHASDLAVALLAEVPGRLWEGKESILGALGALGGAASKVGEI